MDPSESRNRIRIAVLLFLIVAGYYWKLTLTRQFEWMTGNDLAEQVLPWFHLQAQEWHAGRFPLWDPYLIYGPASRSSARRSPAPPIAFHAMLTALSPGMFGHQVVLPAMPAPMGSRVLRIGVHRDWL